MKFVLYIIDLLEEKAKNKGLPMGKACILGEVTPATFSNWKGGNISPTMRKVQAIFDAIENYQPEEKKNA